MAGNGDRWQLGWPGRHVHSPATSPWSVVCQSVLTIPTMGMPCVAQMELQAASLVFGVNIVVHQAGQPAWNIRNFPKVRRRTLVSWSLPVSLIDMDGVVSPL